LFPAPIEELEILFFSALDRLSVRVAYHHSHFNKIALYLQVGLSAARGYGQIPTRTRSSSAELIRTDTSHVGVQGEVVVQVAFAGEYVERPGSSKRLFSISRSLMKLLD
jgi:hypothetical protein